MMDTNPPFEPVKLNAGSDPTKAKEMPDAGTSKEEEQPVLGKRARDAKNEPSTDGKKKTKVEESADSKADRRRILEEKKRMLADIEKELAKISRKAPSLSSSTPGLKQSASAPTTPMLSASTPLPAPRGVPSGRGRGRGAARGAAAATPVPVVPAAIEPEGEPATTTAVFADPPAPPARGKRKSSAGIPRRASHDVSTLPTSPTPEGPVTRAKRARRPKRLDAFGGPVQLTWALKQCQVLLKTLMTHRFGWPFNQPVDPIALNIPDYFDVIKNPMDLGTIKEQLDSGSYEHEDEFATDVRLVFSNTFTYNQPGSDIVLMASTLSGIFEEKFKALKAKVGDHVESGEAVEQSMRELRESVSTIQRDLERFKKTSNGRGRAEDQRPMTFDEKKKLSQAINTLPSEHLGMVVKIIHERMPQLTASGEEIEIDIDALNPATLRHLERFVRSVTQRTAGRSRRGSRTPSLSGSSKSVQTESLVPQGTQQKIEDVERQIKALTEHQQALTQKGLARSTGEGDLLLAAAEKKRNDESETSESETDGSDSESSDSESSDSESDSGSDSESTDSESEKRDNTATAVVTSTQPATASLATTVTAPINVGSVPSDLTAGESSSEVPAAADVTSGSVAGEAAASAPSPATTPMSSGVEDEKSAAHHNQENGKAISFSFDPKDSILPAEAGNGDESLTQAAVAMDDAPPKSEAPKQVALKNVDAWSELSDDFETPATAVKPQSPPSLDKTWSQFQTKKMQDAIREKERLEKEERERKERERREEERRLEEERRRREQEEAEERRRRELELAAQRERERQRQAERLARERGDMSVMEQSLLMASFEQQAAPALPIFQYKSLDDVSEFGDLDDDDAPPAANDHASSNGSHPAALDDDAPHPLFDGEEEEPEPEPPRVVNPETSSFGAGEEAVAGPVEDAMDQEEAPAP